MAAMLANSQRSVLLGVLYGQWGENVQTRRLPALPTLHLDCRRIERPWEAKLPGELAECAIGLVGYIAGCCLRDRHCMLNRSNQVQFGRERFDTLVSECLPLALDPLPQTRIS